MKRIRLMSLLLSWACFVCLCSVGFSSWYQFDPVNFEANGGLASYNVVGMDECVYASAGSFQVFEYSSLSFVKSSSTGTEEIDTGEISVVYVVDLAKAKAAMEAEGKTWNGTLTVSVSLGYENIADYGESHFRGLFLLPTNADPAEKKDVAVRIVEGSDITGAGSAPTGAVENSGTEISFTQTLTGLGSTGTKTFSVIYSINVPKCYQNADGKVGNFRYNFGKYLMTTNSETGKATQFITTARIVELLA